MRKCREEFPDASREVLSNMPVDDCITGIDNAGVTVELQQSLHKMMERGEFNLSGPAIQKKFSATFPSKSGRSTVALISGQVNG